MSRLLAPALLIGLALAGPSRCPTASAAAAITRFSCQGAILGFRKLGNQRLASYQDGHGHRIEIWCTRRIFDSQFDLRIALEQSSHDSDGPHDPPAPERLATVGGCFFDNGENDGPIIVRGPSGAYARVDWITETPSHRRKYHFSYDFTTKLLTVTAMVQGCAPVSKIVAPQASYQKLAALLPHPETQACAASYLGNFNPSAPGP
ncbi:MAG TPA: hypothetical protein VMU81_16765 [Acetobacteraceae bacterium]|jgi:hypothetical protein|nr:hypothetical protein [Acetobacteraceae bacterium]